MSGTFGYDGYIYQANVTLYLVLDKIVNHEGIDSFTIELRKADPADGRKDEFTIDLIILSSDLDGIEKCDVVEIKGGAQDNLIFDDIKNNLSQCSDKLHEQKQELVITQKLILRKQEQSITLENIFIAEINDDIENETAIFSTLEKNIQAKILAILNEVAKSEKKEYRSRVIFYSLRHLIELSIKKLASKLRMNLNHSNLESANITINDFFNHPESFTETIIYDHNAINVDNALSNLNNFNKIKRASFQTTASAQTVESLLGSGANI